MTIIPLEDPFPPQLPPPPNGYETLREFSARHGTPTAVLKDLMRLEPRRRLPYIIEDVTERVLIPTEPGDLYIEEREERLRLLRLYKPGDPRKRPYVATLSLDRFAARMDNAGYPDSAQALVTCAQTIREEIERKHLEAIADLQQQADEAGISVEEMVLQGRYKQRELIRSTTPRRPPNGFMPFAPRPSIAGKRGSLPFADPSMKSKIPWTMQTNLAAGKARRAQKELEKSKPVSPAPSKPEPAPKDPHAPTWW